MNATEKIHKLILKHQKEFGFHSNFDFMNEALDELEKERDEFAVRLLKWVNDNYDGLEHGGWRLGEGYPECTDMQILEEFKKTLNNPS